MVRGVRRLHCLFAALNGLPGYVPCWVLGKPESDLVRDVQGPVPSSKVARLMGISLPEG
jgi:hypothetical protein